MAGGYGIYDFSGGRSYGTKKTYVEIHRGLLMRTLDEKPQNPPSLTRPSHQPPSVVATMAGGYGQFHGLWRCNPQFAWCRFIQTPWATSYALGRNTSGGGIVIIVQPCVNCLHTTSTVWMSKSLSRWLYKSTFECTNAIHTPLETPDLLGLVEIRRGDE